MTDQTPPADELPDDQDTDELPDDQDTDELPDDTDPADDGADETPPDGQVAELRAEAAKYRVRARETAETAEKLAKALFRERVDRLGLLADPADLEYSPELLDDPDGIRAAVDELLAERPHLRSRRIRERIGQGEGDELPDSGLTSLLRAGA